MSTDEALLDQLREAARESVRRDWLAERALNDAIQAAATYSALHQRARHAGLDLSQIPDCSHLAVVVDDGVVQVRPHHGSLEGLLFASDDGAIEYLAEIVPAGMDPEVAEERIRLHLAEETTMGGVYLDCTMAELQRDLVAHYIEPVQEARFAS